MALAIRLRQQGRHGHQTYRVVLTDERTRRDGKYNELLGWYNPQEELDEKKFSLNAARIDSLLEQGAIISDRVKALLNRVAPEVMKKRTQKAVEARAKARAEIRAKAKAKNG